MPYGWTNAAYISVAAGTTPPDRAVQVGQQVTVRPGPPTGRISAGWPAFRVSTVQRRDCQSR